MENKMGNSKIGFINRIFMFVVVPWSRINIVVLKTYKHTSKNMLHFSLHIKMFYFIKCACYRLRNKFNIRSIFFIIMRYKLNFFFQIIHENKIFICFLILEMRFIICHRKECESKDRMYCYDELRTKYMSKRSLKVSFRYGSMRKKYFHMKILFIKNRKWHMNTKIE